MEQMEDGGIAWDPQVMLEMIRKDQEKHERDLIKINEYLSTLLPEEFITQLKHLIYRNLKLISIVEQSYPQLSTTEKLMFDALDDFVNGILDSMKWISFHHEIPLAKAFGDTWLVQKIGDVTFGQDYLQKAEQKLEGQEEQDKDSILDC